jgi:hypothetical protein
MTRARQAQFEGVFFFLAIFAFVAITLYGIL